MAPDWEKLLLAARSSNPFEVISMSFSDFKDFPVVEDNLNKVGRLQVTKFLWLKAEADDPTTIKPHKSRNILKPWVTYPFTKPVEDSEEAQLSKERYRKKKKDNTKKRYKPIVIFLRLAN